METIFANLDDETFKIFLIQNVTLDELIAFDKDFSLNLKANLGNDSNEIISKIKAIANKTKNSKVKLSITLHSNKEYIYSQEEIDIIKKINQVCIAENLNTRLELNNADGSVEQFTMARDKIEEFKARLNAIKIGDRPLSVGEKFACVYSFVANRTYNMSENFIKDDMRNWIGVLSGDEVICSGFASTLKMMCDVVFTKDELACFVQGSTVYDRKTNKELGGHANNVVYINDEFYGYKAIRHCDSCWDSINEVKHSPSFNYFMLPMDQMDKYKAYKTVFDRNLYIYDLVGNRTTKDDAVFGYTNYQTDFNEFIENIAGEMHAHQIIESVENQKKLKKEQIENERKKLVQDTMKLYETKKTQFDEKDLQTKVLHFIPKSVIEQFPITEEYHNYLLDLSPDTFDTNKIKEIIDFYKQHQDIIKRCEKAFEKLGSKAPVNEIGNDIKEQLEYNAERSVKDVSDSEYDYKLNQQIEDSHAKTNEVIAPLMFEEDFPEKMLRNGIYASGILLGLNEEEAKQFAMQKMDDRKQYHKHNFIKSNESKNIDG